MTALAALRVLVITDPVLPDDALVRVVTAATAAGLGPELGVQLRDKARPDDAVAPLAVALREVTAAAGAKLLLNGRPALARAVGADGVHLGGGGPTFAEARGAFGAGALTVPAHTDDDVARASTAGAAAVLVSPIFATPGKGPPRGADALRRARALAGGVRILALGGIDVTNVSELRGQADGVAVIRAVLLAADPARAVRALRDAMVAPC